MADPICRWRNPYVNTVAELITILPNEELSQTRAREMVNNRSPYDFYRTPYQLACQLGLYYESRGRYFPKFTCTPTEVDVTQYLTNWIIHYSIPNPYTRGFDNLQPFSIHAAICRHLFDAQNPIQWAATCDRLFQQGIGNNDILVNSINRYSPIISINAGVIHLKENKNYTDLQPFIDVDISGDRNDKEYFFDLFTIPSQREGNELFQNNDLVPNLTRQDVEAISQVQNIPNLSQTEKNQIVAARIGQGPFRRNLLINCGVCPITGVDDSRFLIASHIKPWRISSNQERLDVRNGLMFTATYDKLFDTGFISFTDDKRIIVSPLISDENKVRLSLEHNIFYPTLQLLGREEFLSYHRDNLFKYG
ncbi:MAG: hypothetical protein SCALA702_00060 [Melioribacteraceae bacterium]|nr:MAG: hypothetical protein SCALA702_00060 [Melioribacteraceae bacterium]